MSSDSEKVSTWSPRRYPALLRLPLWGAQLPNDGPLSFQPNPSCRFLISHANTPANETPALATGGSLSSLIQMNNHNCSPRSSSSVLHVISDARPTRGSRLFRGSYHAVVAGFEVRRAAADWELSRCNVYSRMSELISRAVAKPSRDTVISFSSLSFRRLQKYCSSCMTVSSPDIPCNIPVTCSPITIEPSL